MAFFITSGPLTWTPRCPIYSRRRRRRHRRERVLLALALAEPLALPLCQARGAGARAWRVRRALTLAHDQRLGQTQRHGHPSPKRSVGGGEHEARLLAMVEPLAVCVGKGESEAPPRVDDASGKPASDGACEAVAKKDADAEAVDVTGTLQLTPSKKGIATLPLPLAEAPLALAGKPRPLLCAGEPEAVIAPPLGLALPLALRAPLLEPLREAPTMALPWTSRCPSPCPRPPWPTARAATCSWRCPRW